MPHPSLALGTFPRRDANASPDGGMARALHNHDPWLRVAVCESQLSVRHFSMSVLRGLGGLRSGTMARQLLAVEGSSSSSSSNTSLSATSFCCPGMIVPLPWHRWLSQAMGDWDFVFAAAPADSAERRRNRKPLTQLESDSAQSSTDLTAPSPDESLVLDY